MRLLSDWSRLLARRSCEIIMLRTSSSVPAMPRLRWSGCTASFWMWHTTLLVWYLRVMACAWSQNLRHQSVVRPTLNDVCTCSLIAMPICPTQDSGLHAIRFIHGVALTTMHSHNVAEDGLLSSPPSVRVQQHSVAPRQLLVDSP